MLSLRLNVATALLLVSLNSFSQGPQPLVQSSALIEEGIKLHNEGKYKEALAVYNRIGNADSNYVLALYEKALSCQADSMFEQALAFCEEGLRHTDDRKREPGFYTLYGSILDDMNQSERALVMYDSGIAKYPAYSLLYANKAITLVKKEDYKTAEKVIQHGLLIDPYAPSLHYYNGVVSLSKGRIVPAILSYCTYLMILPQGRNDGKAIAILGSIAKNEDAIAELVRNRTEEPPAVYQEIEQIIASKIALDKSYKKLTALDDQICRQLQVVLEKLSYDPDADDYAMHYYVPLYQKIFAGKQFEPFINHIFSAVNIDAIKEYNRKNKKEIQQFVSVAETYLNDIRATRTLNVAKRNTVTEQYHFDNGRLYGYGKLNGEETVGDWKFYYTSGNLKAVGTFDNSGKKNGLWKYYHFNGSLDGEENITNGLLEGAAAYYHENGKPLMKGQYKQGKRQGTFTRYYNTGSVQVVENYDMGARNGPRSEYFPTGVVNSTENYKNDNADGAFVVYYSNGLKEKEGTLAEGKLNGPYSYYYDNGVKAIEGNYENGLASGNWKRFHENGKLKQTEFYKEDRNEGEYTEYHDNGQLYTKYVYKNGKVNGEANYWDADGKLFSTLMFENDKVKWGKYFDKSGKQISESQTSNRKLLLHAYAPAGFKRSETPYNEKGEVDGERRFYFASGTLKEIEHYRDGQLNGVSEAYYPNKVKRFEIAYENGERNGYCTMYSLHNTKTQEGWYRNDKMEGTWITYYDNNVVKSKIDYQEGEQHGSEINYWPNGKKQNEIVYKNGNVESYTQYDTTGAINGVTRINFGSGKMILKYVNGKKSNEGNYKNDMLDGEWKEYYFDGSLRSVKYYKNGFADSIYRQYHYSGKLAAEGQYLRGKQSGTWKFYWPEGPIRSVETYVDGELAGIDYNYHENGKIDREISMKDGERHGILKQYDDQGNLMIQMTYNEGVLESYTYLDKNNTLVPAIPVNSGNGKITAYYPSGKKSIEFELVDDQLNNAHITYFPNGNKMFESQEVYNDTEGEWKNYFSNGKPRSTYQYLHNQEHGPFKEYYSNGNIKKEGQCVRGMYHGRVKSYDEAGKLIETRIYYYDQLLEVHK